MNRTRRPRPPVSADRALRNVGYPLMSGGRYGNSLFQIAATVGIARRFNREPRFPRDWVYAPFHSLPDEWYVDDLRGVIPAHHFANDLPARMRPYLQSLALWDNAVPEVRAALEWSPVASDAISEGYAKLAHLPRPVMAIHIRRGDTITRNKPETIQPLPASYFRDAIELADPASVAAFTDDPEWVREHFPSVYLFDSEPGPEDFEPDFLTRPRRDYIDLGVMQRIVEDGGSVAISNSSYSWWSAWLAGQPERVYFPSRWFGESHLAVGFTVEPILVPGWTRVPVVEDPSGA